MAYEGRTDRHLHSNICQNLEVIGGTSTGYSRNMRDDVLIVPHEVNYF